VDDSFNKLSSQPVITLEIAPIKQSCAYALQIIYVIKQPGDVIAVIS
jgi:hypothetical protein